MSKTEINITILKIIEEIKNKSSYDYSSVVTQTNENFKLKALFDFMQFMSARPLRLDFKLMTINYR